MAVCARPPCICAGSISLCAWILHLCRLKQRTQIQKYLRTNGVSHWPQTGKKKYPHDSEPSKWKNIMRKGFLRLTPGKRPCTPNTGIVYMELLFLVLILLYHGDGIIAVNFSRSNLMIRPLNARISSSTTPFPVNPYLGRDCVAQPASPKYTLVYTTKWDGSYIATRGQRSRWILGTCRGYLQHDLRPYIAECKLSYYFILVYVQFGGVMIYKQFLVTWLIWSYRQWTFMHAFDVQSQPVISSVFYRAIIAVTYFLNTLGSCLEKALFQR
jgi:hypothetical protein